MYYEHTDSREINALRIRDINDLRHLMNNRFKQSIKKAPYYRIYAIPATLNPDAISFQNEKIQEILFNTPHKRPCSYGVSGFLKSKTLPDAEGLKGSNIVHGEIILLKNGYYEYRCPILNSYLLGKKFQQDAFFNSKNWLYPLAVCEQPVSFLRLVRELYDGAGITYPVTVVQEYHNILGLTLPAGSPDPLSLVHCSDGANQYGSQIPIVSEANVYPNFHTDQIAYSLLKNVYEGFGLGEGDIPFFDEGRNFTRDNNYRRFYRKTVN